MEGENQGDERMLGVEPESGLEVWLKSGRFGPYVQLGEPTEENKTPKRSSLPKSWSPDIVDFDRAMQLLALPRLVGNHPEDGEPITSNLGRYGPYVMHKRPDDAKPVYANLGDEEEVFIIGMNRAVEVLAEKRANPRGGGRAAAKALRELGEHPENGGVMSIMEGRYGPYVKWEKVNATLPKDVKPEDLTVAQAVELIDAKAAKAPKKKAPAKKPAAKKPAAKKAAAKKPAAKKAASGD
jgi:DNA topoisomerase-1